MNFDCYSCEERSKIEIVQELLLLFARIFTDQTWYMISRYHAKNGRSLVVEILDAHKGKFKRWQDQPPLTDSNTIDSFRCLICETTNEVSYNLQTNIAAMVRHCENHTSGNFIKLAKANHKTPKVVPYEHFYCPVKGTTVLSNARCHKVFPPDNMRRAYLRGAYKMFCRKCDKFSLNASPPSLSKWHQLIMRMEKHERQCLGRPKPETVSDEEGDADSENETISQ